MYLIFQERQINRTIFIGEIYSPSIIESSSNQKISKNIVSLKSAVIYLIELRFTEEHLTLQQHILLRLFKQLSRHQAGEGRNNSGCSHSRPTWLSVAVTKPWPSQLEGGKGLFVSHSHITVGH